MVSLNRLLVLMIRIDEWLSEFVIIVSNRTFPCVIAMANHSSINNCLADSEFLHFRYLPPVVEADVTS